MYAMPIKAIQPTTSVLQRMTTLNAQYIFIGILLLYMYFSFYNFALCQQMPKFSQEYLKAVLKGIRKLTLFLIETFINSPYKLP